MQAGGLAYLATLARDTPTAANVRAYADIVRERSVLRQLIRVGGELAEAAYRPEGRGTEELVDYAERPSVRYRRTWRTPATQFRDHQRALVQGRGSSRLADACQQPVTGLPTGLNKFDA